MNRRRSLILRLVILPLAGLLIAALGLAVVLPPLIDWGGLKPTLERELSTLAGQPVRIAGAIGVRLLPKASLDLAELRVDNEQQGLKIEADRLIVDVRLFSLLQGQIDVTASALGHPVITIADPSSAGAPAGKPQPANSIASVRQAATDTLKQEARGSFLGSARLSIVDGEVRRASNGAKLVGFDLDMDYSGAKGLITGSGKVGSGGRTQKLRFSVDQLQDVGGHLKLLIDDEVASASAVVDGKAIRDPQTGAPRFEGTVDAIGSVALWNADRPRSLSWRVQSHLVASGNEARFDTLDGTLGTAPFENRFTGEGRISLGANLHLAIVIRSALFDLDRLIGIGAPPVVPPFDAFSEVQQLFGAKSKTPSPFDFHADVAVDALRTGNDDIRNFRFVASGRGEAWTIEQAGGDLPGGAKLVIKGTPLETLSVANILSGHLSLDIPDQRRFFGWIDGQVPAAAATADAAPPVSVKLDADAVFEPKALWLPKIRLDFGGSSFTGDARYVFPVPPKPQAVKRDRGRIDAHLKTSIVDLDSFPLASFADSPYVSPDLDLDLAVDQLSFRTIQAATLKLIFHRDGDRRAIETLSLDNLSGARIEASGTVDPKGSTGRLAIRSTRLDALAETVKVLMPGPLAEVFAYRAPYLSPGTIDIGAVLASESGERIVQFKAAGDLDSTKLTATGDWQLGPSARRNHIDLAFDAGDEVKLLRQLGFNGTLGTVVEPGQLTLKAEGNIARGYDVIAVAKAAQARMDIAGKLVFTSPTAPFDAKMVLTAPDIARLGAVLGANEALVPAGTEAKVTGRLIASLDRILIAESTTEVTRGNDRVAKVTGEAAVHFEDKLRLAGQLKADYLDGRWLATVPLGSAGEAGTAPQTGWSSEPFAAPQPPTIGGAVWIEVEKLAVTPQLAFDGAQFVLRVKPDLLSFDHAELRFGGGRLAGDLSVERQGPLAVLQSRMTAIDVEMQRLSAIPLTTRLNGTMTLAGKGRSPDELVRSIAGDGRFDLGEVRFDTIDVKPVAALAGASADQTPVPSAPADASRAQKLDSAMKTGALLAPSGTLPVAVADGMIQLGPLMLASGSGMTMSEARFDLATLRLMASTQIEAPADGAKAGPQALVTWVGTLDQLKRSVDVDPQRVDLVAPTATRPATVPKQN